MFGEGRGRLGKEGRDRGEAEGIDGGELRKGGGEGRMN